MYHLCPPFIIFHSLTSTPPSLPCRRASKTKSMQAEAAAMHKESRAVKEALTEQKRRLQEVEQELAHKEQGLHKAASVRQRAAERTAAPSALNDKSTAWLRVAYCVAPFTVLKNR